MNSHSITYYLDSLYIPYGMQENFTIMEKTPDYLLFYIKNLLRKQTLDEQYQVSFKQKPLSDDDNCYYVTTNHFDFFKQVTEVISNLEEHFPILLKDYSSFDNENTFTEKLDKFNLYNKLHNKLEAKHTTVIRKKI